MQMTGVLLCCRIQGPDTRSKRAVREVGQRGVSNMRDQPGPTRPRHRVLVPRPGHVTRADGAAHAHRHRLDGRADEPLTHQRRNAPGLGQLFVRADGRSPRLRQRARHQRRTPGRHATRQ